MKDKEGRVQYNEKVKQIQIGNFQKLLNGQQEENSKSSIAVAGAKQKLPTSTHEEIMNVIKESKINLHMLFVDFQQSFGKVQGQ